MPDTVPHLRSATDHRHRVPSPRGGVWNQGTIRAILKNEIYCGDYAWNKTRQGKFHSRTGGKTRERLPEESAKRKTGRRKHKVIRNNPEDWITARGVHQGIIDRDLWLRCQTRMKANTKHDGRPSDGTSDFVYLVTGIAFCGDCGGKMQGRKSTRKKAGKEYVKRKYMCSTYANRGKCLCNNNWAPAGELHDVILETILRTFRDPETIAELRDSMNQQSQTESMDNAAAVKRLTKRLAELNKKVATITARVATAPDELVDDIYREMVKLKRLRDSTADELGKVKTETNHASKYSTADVARLLDSLADEADQLEGVELKAWLNDTIESVELLFTEEPYGKRTRQRLTGGIIRLRKSCAGEMAGAGFEPTTSRL